MATIEYDDIQLKLGSRFDKAGVNRAIDNLTTLKELFPMSGIKETANDMKEFASAINSIKSDTIKALANLKGNLSKATKQLLDKDKLINIPAKITVAETPKDNTIKLPFEDAKPQIQVLDLAKQRAEEERQALAQANSELQAQEEHYKTIAELAHEAVQRSEVPIASSLTDDIDNGATADIDDSYTSSASSWQQTADSIERAKRTLNDYKAIVADIRAEEARNAEQKANTEAITNEWNEIGQAIDADISKTFSFRNAIAVTYDKLMDALGIYKKMPPTVDEIIAKMDELEKKTGGVGKEAKRALSPLEKLVQKFKNFMQYRAMRAVWSAFVNGVKEGFKNLEDWDRATGMTGFAESMDRARESLLVLKNSLAVVSAPFIEILIRGLQQITSWAMAAANAISRFFAILGDKPTYRAVIWADTIAESEKKAGGAAKKATEEFKKQLLAFDEINNITAQSPSGSGGGGSSGGGGGYTDMFGERAVGEVSEVESKLKAIWDWIKKCTEQLKEALSPLLKIKDTIARVVTHTGEFLGKLSVLKKPLDTIWQGVLNVVNAVAGFTSAIIDFAGEVLILFEDVLGVVIEIGDELELWQKMADDAKWKLDLVADVFNSLKVATQQLTAIVEFLGTTIGNLWEVIKGKQSLTEFEQNTADAFQTMQTKIQEASDSFESKIGGAFNKPRAINFDTNGSVTPVEEAAEAVKRVLNSLNGYKPHISIDVTENVTRYVKEFTYKTGKFAEGGFPTQGQMFIAREAGPELVGTIGGQTAVVNNSDIVASVSQGVAQAVASVLGGGQQVNVTLEGDAKNLFKVVQREGRAYSARTGQPALA